MKKENVRRAILELTGEKILFNLVYNELYKIFKEANDYSICSYCSINNRIRMGYGKVF